MNGRHLLMATLVVMLIFSGCAGLQKQKADSEKRITDLTAANVELQQELVKANASLKDSEQAAQQKQSEIAKLQEEKNALAAQVKALDEQAKKSRVSESTIEIKSDPKKELAENLKPKPEADTKTSPLQKSLRIKVLAGTTQMAKAKVLSFRLKGNGYKIEKLDRSPRAFKQTTIYYAESFEKEAKDIAGQIAKDAIIKPISWHSIFNVIIAVGRN